MRNSRARNRQSVGKAYSYHPSPLRRATKRRSVGRPIELMVMI